MVKNSSDTQINQNVGRMEQPNVQRGITGRQDTDIPDYIMNMIKPNEQTYPVKVELNQETIKYLSTLRSSRTAEFNDHRTLRVNVPRNTSQERD